MTATSLRDGKVRRIALDAALLCIALALSYLEHLIPLSLAIPLPGFKLGFANLAVVAAAFLISPVDAGIVSLARVAVSSLLFGSPSSFFFSLGGAVLSFISIIISKYCLCRVSGWIGISVISAACHNIGQLIAAALVLSSLSVWWYFPVLMIAAALTGTLSGIILMLIMPRLTKAVKNANRN